MCIFVPIDKSKLRRCNFILRRKGKIFVYVYQLREAKISGVQTNKMLLSFGGKITNKKQKNIFILFYITINVLITLPELVGTHHVFAGITMPFCLLYLFQDIIDYSVDY